MDAPERDPELRPTGDAGETATKGEQPTPLHSVAPRSRTVLPFSRGNYPYSLSSAQSENDLLRPPEVENDPGPSAA